MVWIPGEEEEEEDDIYYLYLFSYCFMLYL